MDTEGSATMATLRENETDETNDRRQEARAGKDTERERDRERSVR